MIVTPYAICNMTESDIIILKEGDPEAVANNTKYRKKKTE